MHRFLHPSKSLPSPIPTPHLLIYNFFMWIFLATFLIPPSTWLTPNNATSLNRLGFPGGSMVKNPPAMWETWVRSLGWEDTLEKGTATYSIILTWKIPRSEETGGLQSMGLQRVRHDWGIFTWTILQLNCFLPHFLKQRWFSQFIRNSQMKLKNKITKFKNLL